MKQPTAPPSGIPLYPELPITDDGTAGVSTSATSGGNVNVASQQQDQYFRLQEISRLRKHLEDEKDKRSQLYKKYRCRINAVDAVDTALISASMGMGIGGVGLLTTVIAAPVVLGLEIAALGCGLLGVAGKFIGRRLSVKAKKHDEVRVLADSKLNTIADHVSRALTDGAISEEEFRMVVDEVSKYAQMKGDIRAGAKKAHAAVTLDEETKISLIQRGRDEARASLIKKLAAPWVVVYPASAWPVASIRLRQWRAGGGMTRLRGAPRPRLLFRRSTVQFNQASMNARVTTYTCLATAVGGLVYFAHQLSARRPDGLLILGSDDHKPCQSGKNQASMNARVTTYTCLATAVGGLVYFAHQLSARRPDGLLILGSDDHKPCQSGKNQASMNARVTTYTCLATAVGGLVYFAHQLSARRPDGLLILGSDDHKPCQSGKPPGPCLSLGLLAKEGPEELLWRLMLCDHDVVVMKEGREDYWRPDRFVRQAQTTCDVIFGALESEYLYWRKATTSDYDRMIQLAALCTEEEEECKDSEADSS